MRFTDVYIKRPVWALVISAFIVLLGLQAASKLSLREFPELERSVINVLTIYPGASADTVQALVTTPLQTTIAGAKGIDYITSNSNPSMSEITVHVRLGENSSDALSEVIAKVNEARAELPRQVEDPIISNSSGGDALVYISFYSDQMSIPQISDFMVRAVQPELATLKGVGKAEILGSNFLSMRVWLDPMKMAALGVTAGDALAALNRDNVIATAGAVQSSLVRATVNPQTDLQTAQDFARVLVRKEGDNKVYLGDIATIGMGSENTEFRAFSSGRDSVFMGVTPAPGANPLKVAESVRNTLDSLRKDMPADLHADLDWDGSVPIQAALEEVLMTLLEAGVIVVLVIYLFLGSLRVVLMPLVAIPLSLIGVLFIMLNLGFSINLLTLLAMVIAIGLVVDDAIVVVENVHRHIERGATPMQAALIGAREVAMPVIAMTLTLAAVFAPIGFMGGLTGALFTEFALTLAGAVIVSGVVALTLSPMLASRVLTEHDQQGRFATWLDQRFAQLVNAYGKVLKHCLANRGAVLLFALVIAISLPALFVLTWKELAPEEDSGALYVVASSPSYANLDYINNVLDDVVKQWQTIEEIDRSWQVGSPNFNFGGLMMLPWEQRNRTQQEVQVELQAKLAQIPTADVFTFGPPPLPGSDAGLPLNFVIGTTKNYARLLQVSDQVLQAARESGLFIFINQSLQFSRPEIEVDINRPLAAQLGVSVSAIGEVLAVMLGEAEVNRFTQEGRSYKVIPQAAQNFRLTNDQLGQYYVRSDSGKLVSLDTLITLRTTVKPSALTQFQQMNSTTLQGMMMPPNTIATGHAFLKAELAKAAPAGFRAGYTGASRRYEQEANTFPLLFASSMLVIFLVLALQFNSFRDPLIVLVTVPLSIFGAMVPLVLGVTTLNIYTQVGLLTLIGLISKHGILIVDFANNAQREGLDRDDAIIRAAALRLRPILMTTFATVLGVLPLLTASGAGANSRFGIGLVITSGMLVGTLFTLFVVPVLYRALSSTHRKEEASGAADDAAPVARRSFIDNRRRCPRPPSPPAIN